jgi:hypothetical protein
MFGSKTCSFITKTNIMAVFLQMRTMLFTYFLFLKFKVNENCLRAIYTNFVSRDSVLIVHENIKGYIQKKKSCRAMSRINDRIFSNRVPQHGNTARVNRPFRVLHRPRPWSPSQPDRQRGRG